MFAQMSSKWQDAATQVGRELRGSRQIFAPFNHLKFNIDAHLILFVIYDIADR